jgi:hypothetical protein
MQLATLRAKYGALVPVFTERSRRVWAATEAQAIGYSGIALVARAPGMAESTIRRGLRDLQVRQPLPPSCGWRTQAGDRHRPDTPAGRVGGAHGSRCFRPRVAKPVCAAHAFRVTHFVLVRRADFGKPCGLPRVPAVSTLAEGRPTAPYFGVS